MDAAAQADGGPYLGLHVSGSAYEASYSKAVDNTSPENVTVGAGRVFRAAGAANDVTWEAGVLAGWRVPFGFGYADIEGDYVAHRGSASGNLPGEGISTGRNQLGEAWPEEWSLAKKRSYGLAIRLGGNIPPLDALVYVLLGARRLDADLETSYAGCLSPIECAPGEFTSTRERRGEAFDALSIGVGLERAMGAAALRFEVRHTDHGRSARTVRFPALAVTVPIEVEAGETGLGVGLIWRF